MDDRRLRAYNSIRDPVYTPEEYMRGRRQAYPQTYREEYPSRSTERDYKDYSKLTEKAKKFGKRYNRLYKQEKDDFNVEYSAAPMNSEKWREGMYYRNNTYGLHPDQHRPLVIPSHKATTSALRMADARRDYLDKHPYGYRNLRERQKHEVLRDDAYVQYTEHHNRSKTHLQYASDPAAKAGRDPYGRLNPASYAWR